MGWEWTEQLLGNCVRRPSSSTAFFLSFPSSWRTSSLVGVASDVRFIALFLMFGTSGFFGLGFRLWFHSGPAFVLLAPAIR